MMGSGEMNMKRMAWSVLLLVMTAATDRAQEKIGLDKDVEVHLLAPGIWRHVSYQTFEVKWKVPANGLIVVSGGRAAMIDTPWTPEQTAVLLDWLETHLKAKVETAIVGHSHVDCLGGLPEIHRRGATSIGLDKTRVLANVRTRYPEARLIVPGHGNPGGWELVENTLKLLRENSK